MKQKGLTSVQAKMHLDKYGPNTLREIPKRPAWLRFLDQFKDIVVLLLIAAIIISAVLGEFLDAIAIAIIVLFNGIFGYVQENKAEESLKP